MLKGENGWACFKAFCSGYDGNDDLLVKGYRHHCNSHNYLSRVRVMCVFLVYE